MDQAGVALYHRVMRRENFEKAARILCPWYTPRKRREPGKPRTLCLDIDGHRNAQGRFDADMLELQRDSVDISASVSYGSSFPTDF